MRPVWMMIAIVATILTGTVTAVSQTTSPVDTLIEPGRRIGPLRIYMTLDQAKIAMGRAPDSSGVATNASDPWYLWKLQPPQFGGVYPYLRAFAPGGLLDEILTNAKEFKTKGGNGVESTVESFVAEFGRPSSDEVISGSTSRVVGFAGNMLFVQVSSAGTVLILRVLR